MANTKRNRRSNEDIQKAIFESTLEIMNEEGFENVTFAKVAKRSGTNRPVLYRRWETPFELIYDAEQYSTDDVDSFDDIDFSGKNMRENLIAILTHFDDSPEFMKAYLVELGRGTDSVNKLSKALQKQNLFIMERLLSQAQLDGEIKHTVTDYVKLLPFNLILYQAMIDKSKITKQLVVEIVDQVIIPAIMAQQA